MAKEAGNLFKNPDLSRIEDGMPVAWPVGGVTDPENYRVAMQHDIKGEPNVLQMFSNAAETSRYISQVLSVEPGALYEWRAKIYQEGGRALMWVKGLADASGQPVSWEARTYLSSYLGNPLYPDFVSADKMRGSNASGWRTEKVTFRVPKNVVSIRFSIGVYFSTGDLRIGPMELLRLPDVAGKN
jgi:hypothetical protein